MPTAHDEPAGSTHRSSGNQPHPDPHVVIVPDDISSITGPHPDRPAPQDRVRAALVETETAVPDSIDHPEPGRPPVRRRGVLVALLLLAAIGAVAAFPPPPSARGQLLAITLLVLIFGISMWRDISMGVVAFSVAFISGTLYFGVSTAEITKDFPGALVTTLIGVTYLFGVARTNGTIQQIVRSLVGLVHGKVLLLPWVFFMLAAAITASGALSLATYSILIPLGLSFARSHKVSPLVMGLSILNGTNAGGFSPIAIYWVIVNNVLVDNGIHVQPMPVFWWTFAVNVLLNVGACLLFSARNGDRLHVTPTRTDEATVAEHATPAAQDQHWTGQQLLTMALLAAMVVGAIFFHLDVGFAAFCIALVLAVIDPASGKEGTKEIGWGVMLLIAGIVTFINMLETAGIVTLVANNVAHIGTPPAGGAADAGGCGPHLGLRLHQCHVRGAGAAGRAAPAHRTCGAAGLRHRAVPVGLHRRLQPLLHRGGTDAGQYRAVPLRPHHEVADDLGLQHDHHRAGDHLAGRPCGLSRCRLVLRHHGRAAGPCGQDWVPSSSRVRWTSWAICSTSASMPVKVICPRRRATKSTAISVP